MWTASCIALLLALLGPGPVFPAEAQDVDQAMQSFIQAMLKKDGSGILAAFSRQSSWRIQPYEIGTGRRLKANTITPDRMTRDFQQQTGWWDFFTAEPNGYTFRVNFIDGKPWKKRGVDTFVAPESSGDTYIKWRYEKPRWVIQEIGETSP